MVSNDANCLRGDFSPVWRTLEIEIQMLKPATFRQRNYYIFATVGV